MIKKLLKKIIPGKIWSWTREKKVQFQFLTEQKWGLQKPRDNSRLPKYKLKKYLPKNPVIIDCGANDGNDSVELAQVFSKGVIHSIEPLPSVFEVLRNNTVKYPNIFCHKLALSNENGTAELHVSSGASDGSSSLLKPTGHKEQHPDVLFDNTVTVTTNTLDTWAEMNNISHVDFLWLDMQGFEYQMLKASTVILPTVKVIYTEVSLVEQYEGSLLYKDFKNWLENKGFKMIAELPDSTEPCNVLFVK